MTVGRAYSYLRAWTNLAHRAAALSTSLDPRTDAEPIAYWRGVFHRAMERQWVAYHRLRALCPPNPRPLP